MAIPAWIVTGPLGSGKTTVIARLLARKPPAENWVVLLNEFSDAGIDALTIATAARGAYDVRLVPGGCLCCAGEQDFRRNLRELVGGSPPDRLIVEPSGLGHPAGIVEELLGYEARGQLQLQSVLAVLDAPRIAAGECGAGTLAHDQAEIADALALSKADLADAATRERFQAFAAQFYPAKRWVGAVERGELDPDALRPAARGSRVAAPGRPAEHERERSHAHESHQAGADGKAAAPPQSSGGAQFRLQRHLGHEAGRWVFPRAIGFSREAIERALAAKLAGDGATGEGIVRLKGVFRVAEDEFALVQFDGRVLEWRASSWRRDSRVEVLSARPGAPCWPTWDGVWASCREAASR